MRKITKQEILEAVQGENAFGQYDPKIEAVVTDSREVQPHSLYVAIQGERVDGHDFIESAIDRGASLVLSERKARLPARKELIFVEDTVRALGKMAAAYLRKFNLLKFAVTGSSGKTTTKDMIYYVLAQGLRTHRSEGNHNNEIGLPMTVMQLSEEVQAAVFEMGMYTLGEIDDLAEIVRPNVAVITNIGTCHIENLKTQENIFKAKMEISNYLCKEDLLIVNGDDAYLGRLEAKDFPFRLIKCGLNGNNDLAADDVCVKEGQSYFRLRHRSENLSDYGYDGGVIELPAIGDHNIQNALCAIACGLSAKMSIPQIAQGLQQFRPSELRMQVKDVHGVRIIDDSYNANPESMQAVLASVGGYGGSRKIAVLGDMLELGEWSQRKHQEIGRQAAKYFDLLFFIGSQMRYAAEEVQKEKNRDMMVFHFMDNESALRQIRQVIKRGDLLLFKGSRGMKLDEIAKKLTTTED